MSDEREWGRLTPQDVLAHATPVRVGAKAAALEASGETVPDHDCEANAVPYVSDGALGHGWECAVCGAFLQAG